jgi:hypothetical protein
VPRHTEPDSESEDCQKAATGEGGLPLLDHSRSSLTSFQLDKIANPGLSKEEVKMAKKRERERQRRKKAKKKALKKEGGKEREENDDDH